GFRRRPLSGAYVEEHDKGFSAEPVHSCHEADAPDVLAASRGRPNRHSEELTGLLCRSQESRRSRGDALVCRGRACLRTSALTLSDRGLASAGRNLAGGDRNDPELVGAPGFAPLLARTRRRVLPKRIRGTPTPCQAYSRRRYSTSEDAPSPGSPHSFLDTAGSDAAVPERHRPSDPSRSARNLSSIAPMPPYFRWG